MGARHNRKRTRSRPRNRTTANQKSRSLSLSSPISFASTSSIPAQQPSATHWHQQYSLWQNRSRSQQELQARREHQEAMAAETQRLRIFGGEAGDEVSLCAPMLQVVTECPSFLRWTCPPSRPISSPARVTLHSNYLLHLSSVIRLGKLFLVSGQVHDECVR